MKLGDYTELAKEYANRPGYNHKIIKNILNHIGASNDDAYKVADIGAGTGKLTKSLLEMSLNVTAVEPNDAMRKEGMLHTNAYKVQWVKGTAEETNLPSAAFKWVVMASSFHWTNPLLSLPEFSRILDDKGFFTAIWNPRNVEASDLNTEIENIIYNKAPFIKRVSSGGKTYTKNWEEIICSTGHFKDVEFMEMDHIEIMSTERYMGAWRSVNDIRVQTGEKLFSEILQAIEDRIRNLQSIEVPYKMRAWTAKKCR